MSEKYFPSDNSIEDMINEIQGINLSKLDLSRVYVATDHKKHTNKSSKANTNKLSLIHVREFYPLEEIPSNIGNLLNLKELLLSNNRIKDLPIAIMNLLNLEVLNLAGNHISSLFPEFTRLKKLEELDLSNNNFLIMPPEIGKLSNLETIILSGNKINALSENIKELKKLKHLDLRDNPIAIPLEILEKTNDPQTIIDYYFSYIAVDVNKKMLGEAKVLIVGQGSVGKTSLVQQILHGKFDQSQNKTEGISINQWTIDSRPQIVKAKSLSAVKSKLSIKLNIWDFGGQEIMHATHQFFLTKRSLYILVLDARLTQEENRVEYWLKIIQSFGGESPVLIVGNKTDQHPLDIDRTGLQKKYPSVVGILETSAATGVGIEVLKSVIAKRVNALPHVHGLLPQTWFTVKSKLEELGKNKNFFTQDEYLGLCNQNDVKDETSQRTLIGFMHDLGVVLHFQDDPRLEALGILNAQWVTNGVYKILNSHELFQNQGKLTMSLLNKILNLPEYPSNKHLFIVDMMKKFELCYEIESDKSFLIPDLLPKDEPFTGNWDEALAFEYHYNILPSSIISRFIMRMNSFVYKKTVWRSGVVLELEGNVALIKADAEDRRVLIRVNGDLLTRREFLSAIRMEFSAIHKTIVKIEATEKIPLINAPGIIPIDLEFLRSLARQGRDSLTVYAGNRIIDLIVKEVLNRVEAENTDTEKGNIIHIHGNVEGSSLIVGNKNKSAIKSKMKRK